MTIPLTVGSSRPLTRSATDWLCLAASPTFAIMAWVNAGDPMALCTSDSGPLPLSGMVSMYLLMSLFHLPPWLMLVSRRVPCLPLNSQTEGD
ncbi:hypothetical protein NN6n1_32230 [Shinella zoogloeoides]